LKIKSIENGVLSAVSENLFLRVAIGGLIIVVMVLVQIISAKSSTVILTPFTLNEKTEISKNAADSSYKASIALSVVGVIGFVNEKNAGSLFDLVSNLIHSSIFQDVKQSFADQAEVIRADNLTTRFEMKSLKFDEALDRVFVNGIHVTKGTSGKENLRQRTFEFGIEVSNYMPEVRFFDVYDGDPHDTAYLVKRGIDKDE